MASLLFISVLCAMFLGQNVAEKRSNTSMTNSAIDLKGQMFSVNRDGWVKLQSTDAGTLSSFTVCLRQMCEFSEDQRVFTLNLGDQFISLTGSFMDWNFTVGMDSDTFQTFFDVDPNNSVWTTVCSTWTSSSGMAQVWVNGSPSVRKGLWRNQVFTGLPVLGLYGFVGQVTDVHVWNYELTPLGMASFSMGYPMQGTVLNWRKAQYTTSGYVVLEPMQYPGPSNRQMEGKMQRGNRKRGEWVMGKHTEGATAL